MRPISSDPVSLKLSPSTSPFRDAHDSISIYICVNVFAFRPHFVWSYTCVFGDITLTQGSSFMEKIGKSLKKG